MWNSTLKKLYKNKNIHISFQSSWLKEPLNNYDSVVQSTKLNKEERWMLEAIYYREQNYITKPSDMDLEWIEKKYKLHPKPQPLTDE